MKRQLKGFTLVELLLVVMVIGILVSIAVPAAFNARKKARLAEAMGDVRSIEAAVKAYYEEYGKLPVPTHNQGEYFTADNSPEGSEEVIKALAARDEKGDAVRNPKEITFLDVSGEDKILNQGRKWQGEFLDPWGSQYEIKFDADYSGKVEFYAAGDETGIEEVDSIAVVISRGPDKLGPWDSGQPNKLTDEVTSYYAPGQ